MTWAVSDRQALGGVMLLATTVAGLVAAIGLRDAQSARLTAPYPLNGHLAVYPPINNAQYSRSCRVFRAYEDRTAFAFCQAERSAYRWEPSQQRWISITTTR